MTTPGIDDLLSIPQQRSIALADKRLNIWQGPARSGKTISSLLRFLIDIAAAPAGHIVIVGRTLQTISRNVLAPLQDERIFGPLAEQTKFTEGSGIARVLGRKVHLIGASDSRAESKLRGMTIQLVYVDEITLLAEDFWVMLLSRLTPAGSKLLGTTNPDAPMHWLRQDYLLRQDELDLATFSWPITDNPLYARDPGFRKSIDQLMIEYTGIWRERFIEGRWTSADGSVYSGWDENRHVVSELPGIVRWLGVGLDYGTSHATAGMLLALGIDQKLYIASEYYSQLSEGAPAMTDAEISAAVEMWLENIDYNGQVIEAKPEYIWLDPAAASLRAQMHRDGARPMRAKNSVLDGIRTVASLLAADKLKVHESCVNLRREIPGYVWDKAAAAKGEDKVVKRDDDAVDAMRYAVYSSRQLWQHIMQNR